MDAPFSRPEADCDPHDFLAYLRANDDTRELADQLRWALARRATLASLERRRAS